jgi:hypothetical protein
MMKVKSKKVSRAREYWLVLFTNAIGEKTGHVYYSRKDARHFNYPKCEILKVREVLPKRRIKD